MHFNGDIKNRIPSGLISIEKGLEDRRLFQLKKHLPEIALVAVLAKQIESLKNFLNVKSNFNSDQILDTCELILQEYDDMSFTAIMDCINRVKTAKPPFGGKLYESIDGRKIFEFLETYRMHQTIHLETSHLNKKAQSEFSFAAIGRNEKHGETMKELLNDLNKNIQINRPAPKKETPLKEDTIVKEWIADFHELQKQDIKLQQHGQLDLYLQEKMNEYNKNRKQKV